MTRDIAIRELLHLGYEVFVPVGEGLKIVVQGGNSNVFNNLHLPYKHLSACVVRTAHKSPDPLSKRKSPSVRITNLPKGTNYLIAVYGQDVWMIPVVDIPNSKQIIRLGKRYDEYMITQPKISQQQFDLISDEDAKDVARKVASEEGTDHNTGKDL